MNGNLRALLKKNDNSMSRAAARHVKRLPPPGSADTRYISGGLSAADVEKPVEKPASPVENRPYSVENTVDSANSGPYGVENRRDYVKMSAFAPMGENLPEKGICECEVDGDGKAKRLDGRVMMILSEDILPNPMQPRRSFDREGVARLAESIRLHGMIQPLCVRELDPPSHGYGLIAGERRLRAAKLIGMERVPCIISPADGRRCAEIAIVENLQREDLNMFEQAMAIGELMELHCLTQEKIAARLSCSQSYVANKLRLLKLTREDMELILSEGLTERHARTFLRIKDPEARGRAMRAVVRRRMNVAATEAYVDSLLAEKTSAADTGQGKTTVVLRDLRIFHNTLDKALDFIKKAGVPVETVRREDGEHTEITIRLPRQ